MVLTHVRFPLSLRNVEDLLFERGIDGLRSYPAAMRELGNDQRREVGWYLNNRVKNSHLPFRRRERAMLRCRRMKSLQKFASVQASMHDHSNSERHLVDRQACYAGRPP